jgi:hypothetical protein
MDKTAAVGAAFAYVLFVLLVTWISMLTLGAWGINISFLLTFASIFTLRMLYLVVKGNFEVE